MTEEGKGITADNIDLRPLLGTLNKISMGRVLQGMEKTKEGELTKIEIPVRGINLTDKKDTMLRNFSKDWIRKKIGHPIGIDTRFHLLPQGTSWYEGETEVPVVAALIISFWPKKKSDFDELRIQQKKNGFIPARIR